MSPFWSILHQTICAIGIALALLKLLSMPPRWVDAGPSPGCEVRNRYSDMRWQGPPTTVTWSGPCADGMASGHGALEWFRDGKLDQRYEGEMRAGLQRPRCADDGEPDSLRR